ncbi:MAG: 1-phosphofructokinase family hexose kinase [Rubellimicrobium sp.]|nr:1-phosphofructokinase family hexose kinase [Rubellimicrobium sp.]
MRDILTVTLNPALDLATAVDHVVPNLKLRCDPAHTDPGGGGINVSRAIALLGGRSRCLVALGGDTGRRMARLLAEAGIDLVLHETSGETRSSFAVVDRQTGEQFRFMLPGPHWSVADVAAVRARVLSEARPDGLVVLSGSLPPGAPGEMVPDLCAALAAAGARVVADTSGPALFALAAQGGAARPHVLRMNHAEADMLADRPLPDLAASADFASSLVARGVAEVVIVARGPEGSVLATGGLRLHSRAADVPVKSKVGAGDSFVGSFTLALAEGAELAQALTRGVAAASAAVMTDGTLLCRPEDVARLIDHCPAHPI